MGRKFSSTLALRTVLPNGAPINVGDVISGRRVVERAGQVPGKKTARWLVKCLQCGFQRLVSSHNLRRGKGCHCQRGLRGANSRGGLEARAATWKKQIDMIPWTRQARRIREGVQRRGYDRGNVTGKQVEVLWKWREGKCAYCGATLVLQSVQWDHIHPLSRGGENIISNLEPSCRPCNGKKSNLTGEEFRLWAAGLFFPIQGIARAGAGQQREVASWNKRCVILERSRASLRLGSQLYAHT